MNAKFALRAAALAMTLALAAGAAQARSTSMLELGRQDVVTASGSPLSVEAMRKAIIVGGSRHTWKPVADQPGVLTLEADSGSHQVLVDVAYDEKGFQIRYKSSANMNFSSSGGKSEIHPKYNKWVSDLSNSIRASVLSAGSTDH